MEKITMLIQFIIAITIIIGIHELGHLLFAKLFKIKVESYGIGMPPKIITVKLGETEYYVGAIPLGGAVKLSGMIYENLELNNPSNSETKTDTYYSKPTWQKLLVILGGIFFNFMTGFCIYTFITYCTTDQDISKKEIIKHGINTTKLAQEIGFKNGDKILEINSKDYMRYGDLLRINKQTTLSYKIKREEQELNIYLDKNAINKIKAALYKGDFFIRPRIPFAINNISTSNDGIYFFKTGDKVVSIAGREVHYINELEEALRLNIDKCVEFVYLRDNKVNTVNLLVDKTTNLNTVFTPNIEYIEVNYGLFDALAMGLHKVCYIIVGNAKGISTIFKGKLGFSAISKSLSGPIGIAKIFSGNFSTIRFWSIVAMLSITIGFMNLLPIPALDGGHGLLLIYEMITKKKITDNVIITMQKVGLFLLLSLAIFTTINDVIKIFI